MIWVIFVTWMVFIILFISIQFRIENLITRLRRLERERRWEGEE